MSQSQPPYGNQNQFPYPTSPNPQFPQDPYSQSGQGNVQNPYATQDPFAGQPQDPYMSGYQDSYANVSGYQDPFANNPNQGFAPNPQFPQDPYSDPSLFQDKKAGSKKLLIAIVALILVLLIAAGALIFASSSGMLGGLTNTNNNSNQSQKPPTPPDNSSDPEIELPDPGLDVDISKTGGSKTPATNARLYSKSVLPKDWIAQKFRGQWYTDSQGNCSDENYCGPWTDPDNDGVSNIEEYNFGLDPLDPDTDSDGIADGDELYVYHTSPVVKDSDGDGYLDFIEVTNCYDPTNATSEKMTKNHQMYLDLSTIEANVALNPLRQTTVNSFKSAPGFVMQDLSRGYILANCQVQPVNEVENNIDEE